MQPESNKDIAITKRRRWQLWCVIGCVLITVAVVIGWQIHRAKQQRWAIEQLAKTYGSVKYTTVESTPQFLVDWFGKDAFARPSSLEYFERGYSPMTEWPANRAQFEAVYLLPEIEYVWVLDTVIPYEVLQHVPRLRKIEIDISPMNEEEVDGLIKLQQLRHLRITWCAMSNESALRLRELDQLETLDLRGNDLSEETMESLRDALPNCTITN